MTDRDALAREMMATFYQEPDPNIGISEWPDWQKVADIALRHIEAARAGGFREGLDRALSAIDSERLADPIEETDAAYERALDDAGEAIHAIRAGSPAPAAPEPFLKPRRKDGKTPCGECHIQPGEICDICGASHAAAAPVVWTDAQVEAAWAMISALRVPHIDDFAHGYNVGLADAKFNMRAALEAASREWK